MGWYWSPFQLGIVAGLIWFTAAFNIVLVIGAAVVYYVNRRLGGAVILGVSIIALFLGFMGMYTVMFGFNFFSLIIYILSPVLGIVAGAYGLRGEKRVSREVEQEII